MTLCIKKRLGFNGCKKIDSDLYLCRQRKRCDPIQFMLGLITNKWSGVTGVAFERFKVFVPEVGIKPESQGSDKTQEIFVCH